MSEGQKIGTRLCQLRTARNLTQEQVANAIHTGRANYAKMESGDRDIKSEHCIALAKFFNVSCDYILTGISASNMDVNKDMGLSERTIEELCYLQKEINEKNGMDRVYAEIQMDAINAIISDYCGREILFSIYNFVNIDFDHLYILKDDAEKPFFQPIKTATFAVAPIDRRRNVSSYGPDLEMEHIKNAYLEGIKADICDLRNRLKED